MLQLEPAAPAAKNHCQLGPTRDSATPKNLAEKPARNLPRKTRRGIAPSGAGLVPRSSPEKLASIRGHAGVFLGLVVAPSECPRSSGPPEVIFLV